MINCGGFLWVFKTSWIFYKIHKIIHWTKLFHVSVCHFSVKITQGNKILVFGRVEIKILLSCTKWFWIEFKCGLYELEISHFLERRLISTNKFSIPLIELSASDTNLGLQQRPRWSSLGNNSQRLPAVNYYHKVLHLGCCSSPRSASEHSNIGRYILPYKKYYTSSVLCSI